LDAALKRQKTVLSLMVEDGYINQAQADQAAAEMEAYDFTPVYTDRIPAAHFVFYVQQWVEEALGPEALYTGSGLRIHTTLDQRMQSIAEEEVKNGVAALAERAVTNGALVAVEPATGNILAMVGSVDFYSEEIGGQVNVTTRCRQPGSAIKPLTYLAAFEQGWTPATVVWDLPKVYTDTAGNVYEPVNYDGEFRGPTSVRAALANSLNIPAVKALEFVTVDGLLDMADRLGATSLVSPQLECPDYPLDTRPYYGLALTLGGGEMKPLDLTGAYATFANSGLRMEPTPILWIEDNNGNIVLDNRQREGKQIISPQLAYVLTHILSDTQARCLVFSCPNVLELPGRPAAAKTGTTNDNRDAWTVGYTPDLAVGVWVGNNDNAKMSGVVGSNGAGPIWNRFMVRALEGTPVRQFPRPQGVVEREVCIPSGVQPAEGCPERRVDVFALEAPPPEPDKAWFQALDIDRSSGLRANEFCRSNVEKKVMVVLENVEDPDGRKWLRNWALEHGYEFAPQGFCTTGSVAPQVVITRPASGAVLTGLVDIFGTVSLDGFREYEVQYGVSDNPLAWGMVAGPITLPVNNGRLATWDTTALLPGIYSLRVVARNQQGAQFEARVVVTLLSPTATETPTATPSPTPTGAGTLTPTPDVTPTPTATTPPDEASPTPTSTPEPTPPPETPTPTPTPTPEPPTDTPPPDVPTDAPPP
ncbi:MAG: hypothetical protein JXB35_09335, partial [Anaerolineae bacterium]|nr:hypothetical protein [Anaerolineae bacterium]